MSAIANRQLQVFNNPLPVTVLAVGESLMLDPFLVTQAGYQLHTVGSAEAAIRESASNRFDIVVLANGLARAERLVIEEALARLRPRPRVILLYQGSIAKAEQADAVLSANGDPRDLVRTIQYLLTGKC